MSVVKQKRKAALEYLLDGKDNLSSVMQINYNKQYGEFLFSEKNVLKNLRDANIFIEKADKVMGSLDNLDKKELVNKNSIYAPYFSGQGNTVPVSPKKKTKQRDLNNEEQYPQNIRTQHTNQQHLETNHSNISNQKLNNEINELINTQQANNTLIRNDTLFIDSVQQNNLHSMKMQNALRIKQLKEKDRYGQIYSKQISSMGQSKSQSLDAFIPFGNERNNLGYIIDPINDFAIQSQRKKKNINFPIERQRVSLIVPPNPEKVLVMKRGIHFFEKGQKIKTKREDNHILMSVFKQQSQSKNPNEESQLQQLNKKQKTEYLQQQQQLFNQQINENINSNRINSDGNASILSSQIDPALLQSSIQNQSLLYHNSSEDQNSILKLAKDKLEKIQNKSELNSSNNLPSNTTTFHNSTQLRNNSQDSILPKVDNKKLNVLSGSSYQPSQYYMTPSATSPLKEDIIKKNQREGQQFLLPQNDEKSTSISQLNQVSSILQNSQVEIGKHTQNSMHLDSQKQINQTQHSVCANPSCREHLGGTLLITPDVDMVNKNSNQKYRKNMSMNNINTTSQNAILLPSSSNHHQQSKTMTGFDRKVNKRMDINNEIVTEEKLDASASMVGNNNESNIVNNNQPSQQFVEVSMKQQNKAGEISEFHIGKFMIAGDQNEEKELVILPDEGQIGEQQLQQVSTPMKKTLFNNNVHFKWKMNALDEAQLIEMIRKENESKVKLPKISIYNKKKYTSDQYPAPGDYDPNYSCIEKHYRQVYFDKANLSQISPISSKNQNQPIIQQLIPKSKSTFLPKNIVQNKEEGYEIMFSDLMKDIKKEVRNQKVQNKELQHPMQGLLLNAIPHQSIIELNKDMGNSMSYCKTCLNNIKYYLRADNPTFSKKQMQIIEQNLIQQNFLNKKQVQISQQLNHLVQKDRINQLQLIVQIQLQFVN